MNIAFLTSGHEPYDDRIFYHMAGTFSGLGWAVEIVSSKTDLKKSDNGIKIDSFYGDKLKKIKKIKEFINRLELHNPEIIICSEPLTVIAAKRFANKHHRKVKILYDITEWYPSKKNLEGHNLFIKLLKGARLFMFNLIASSKTDGFIFGEWYKSRPYKFIFPQKPYVDVTYYPDSKYFNRLEPSKSERSLKLCYTGRISIEKGFGRFQKVLNMLADQNKELIIEAKIIGWYESRKDEDECKPLIARLNENIVISFYERQPLGKFIGLIRDTDIFIDLRSEDFENNRCLPIKLFYYAALGRPVIFSGLKAIRKEVDILKFGFMVHSEDIEMIARIITRYLTDRVLYLDHCSSARRLFETQYNWKKIEPELIDFINEISSH